MTEEEWLAATDPTPMLSSLSGQASHRKRRLFGCACCRRFWHLAPDCSRQLIELAERYSDKRYTGERITRRQIDDNLTAANESMVNQPPGSKCAIVAADCLLRFNMEGGAAVWAARAFINDARGQTADKARDSERAVQAALLRDIIGNPFRPVPTDPSWLTSTVVSLAGGIYSDRAFDRLPILADALQDAGCDDADILNHCRSDGPHVRAAGWWTCSPDGSKTETACSEGEL